jgi:hypothetical protein
MTTKKDLIEKDVYDPRYTTKIDKKGVLHVYDINTGEEVNRHWEENRVHDIVWSFSPDLADVICDMVANGKSLHAIGKLDGFPPPRLLYKWKNQYPMFARELEFAYEMRADIYRDKALREIEMSVDRDDIAVAKGKLDAYKWAAEVDNRKKYGTKIEKEITTTTNRILKVITNVPRQALNEEAIATFEAEVEEITVVDSDK